MSVMVVERENGENDVEAETCTHENVRSSRCHLHYGWCGVCLDCGSRVHARLSEVMANGKWVYRKTAFHANGR